jgi:DNA-binding transcriptional ArsR family regulator
MFSWVMIDRGAEEYTALAEVLRATASPLRVALLHRVADGPASVSELVADLRASQPLVSHHLGILRGAGLLRAERTGRTVSYRIADTPLAWSIVAVVRQQLATAGGSVRSPDAEPEFGEIAVPHGDHVDYIAGGRFVRLNATLSRWVDCEPVDHLPHRAHAHVHGTGCGHVGVPHRDHIDYLHNGHRHAAHGDHYDDH